MSFLAPLLGGLGQAIPGLLGGAASGPQAMPGYASRSSSDYSPVTNINAVGAPDLKNIGDLINSIGTENANNASLLGYLKPGANSSSVERILSGQTGTYVVIGAIVLVALLIWKKK
jgi:hypothetical protein